MAVPNTHEGPARIGAIMDGVRSRGGSVYCIGIGGVMMASLAILTARAGFPVSGSDRAFAGGCDSPTAQRLTAVCGLWEAVRRLCCEVEHSEENLEALRLAFLRDAALSPGAFLCQMRS